MGLTRRYFLRWILGLPLLPYGLFRVDEVGADSSNPEKALPHATKEADISIGRFFDGEELVYEAGFWMVKRAALGRLSFKADEKKGLYTATLQGETLGVLGWAARYRVHTYRSVMQEIDGGRRLRGLSFEEDVKVGSTMTKRIHLFDYERRKWTSKRRRRNGMWVVKEQEIPQDRVYDDFITAAYNFRYGVYGPIERGKRYVVATFPRKGASSYEVMIVAKDEEEKRRTEGPLRDGKDFFARLKLDPELTHSKEGVVEGWLTKDLYPVEGAIRDVVFVGDIKGTLIQRKMR